MEKEIERLANFAAAKKADRDFYKKLTGNQRLQICVELSTVDSEQPLERIYRIRKLSDLLDRDP